MRLNKIIEDFYSMLTRTLRENIQLNLKLRQDTGQVKVDIAQVEQALMNLVVNAQDAMPEGGSLTVETMNLHFDEEDIKTNPEMAMGSYVGLWVSDTGSGMSPEVLRHVFEPFFTTKDQGKGTGLGLATVHGIVKQHGGFAAVYSEENLGTTIKLFFPRGGWTA